MKDNRLSFLCMTFVLILVLIMGCWMHTSYALERKSAITIHVSVPDSFFDDIDDGVLDENNSLIDKK